MVKASIGPAQVIKEIPAAAARVFVLELVLPLYLTGLHSGLVVDLGYKASRVLPVSAGVPVISAYSEAGCGAKDALQVLEKALQEPNERILAPRRRLKRRETGQEDVLVCACYVACSFPQDKEHAARVLKTEQDAEERSTWRPRQPIGC